MIPTINFLKSSGFKRYFRNTLWLFLTVGLRLFTGFFVGLWLARYLGPEEYGTYNYVISIISIFITVAMFGTPEYLVKSILESKDKSLVILKDGFNLRAILSSILFALLVLYAYLFENNDIIRSYLLASSFALFFQTFEVVDSFFRANVQVRNSSISRMSQLLLSALLKIVLILYGANLKWFYIVFVFDAVFYAVLIMAAYLKNNVNFLKVKRSLLHIREVALGSFPLMIIAVASLMLARFDLVLIGKILGQSEVGFYSAASKIIEIGSLFSALVPLSLYPAILNSRQTNYEVYMTRMGMLNRFLVWAGILLSIIVYSFAGSLITLLFGERYSPSIEVIKILSLNITFLSFYQVSFRWYLSNNLQQFLMYKTLGAVVLSVLLNLLLIPRYGVKGAAITSVTISFFANFLFEAFFKKTRECFKINTSFLFLN